MVDPYQCDQVHTKLLIEYLTLAVLDEFLDSKGPLFQAKLANLKKDANTKASKKTGDKGTANDGEGEASDAEKSAKKKKPTTSAGKKKRAVCSDSDRGTSASSEASSSDRKAPKKKQSRAPRPKKKAKPADESGEST